MKKLLIFTVMAGLFMACQPTAKQHYFTESAEIDMAKEVVAGYLSNDYTRNKEIYSADAELHHNSTEAMNIDQLIAGFNEQAQILNSKNFVDPIYEMVIDSKEETWVYFWGEWKADLINGKSVTVPVHVAWRFADGKINKEWAYYDNAIINAAMAPVAGEGEMEETEEGA